MTQAQTELLLEFFRNEGYDGWKHIALNLIESGECTVAGEECIWKGGIGNFIKVEKSDTFIKCVKYKFDLKYFLSSEWFKEYRTARIAEMGDRIKILQKTKISLEEKIKEIQEL